MQLRPLDVLAMLLPFFSLSWFSHCNLNINVKAFSNQYTGNRRERRKNVSGFCRCCFFFSRFVGQTKTTLQINRQLKQCTWNSIACENRDRYGFPQENAITGNDRQTTPLPYKHYSIVSDAPKSFSQYTRSTAPPNVSMAKAKCWKIVKMFCHVRGHHHRSTLSIYRDYVNLFILSYNCQRTQCAPPFGRWRSKVNYIQTHSQSFNNMIW